MPLFVYTTIKIIDNKVHEEDGMIYGSDKDGAIRYLSSLNFVIRDLREANKDDVRIARLRAFRDGFNKPIPKVMISPIRRIKWKFLVLFLIVVLCGWLIWRLL
jgi:hypothetical protein